MYSPLNAVSSSQTGVIAVPDSPERRTTAYTTENTSGTYDACKAKSESPELAVSVHEFPSSSALSGTNDTCIQSQAIEDPIIPSQPDPDPRRPNAQGLSGQTSVAAMSSDLQERKVTSEGFRRSPFVDHLSSRTVPSGEPLGLNISRQQTPNLADPIQTGEGSSQAQQGQGSTERPKSPQSPLTVAVSAVVVSSLESNNTIRNDTYGESLLPGIRKELSTGPKIVIESGTISQDPDEHQPLASPPPMKRVSYVPSSRCQAALKLMDDEVTSLDETGSEADKAWSPDHLKPVLPDQALSPERGQTETRVAKGIEPEPVPPTVETPNASEEAMRHSQRWVTSERRRSGVATLQDAVMSQVRVELNPELKDRSVTKKGAEIISIEETEDEWLAAQPEPTSGSAVTKPDIWSVPPDTDVNSVTGMNENAIRLAKQGDNRRSRTGRKARSSNSTANELDTAEKLKQQPTDLEIAAEKERQEREKKDRANSRKRERAAERKAEEAKWAEDLRTDDAKALKDRRNQDTEAVVMQQNAKAKTAKREQAPSADVARNKPLNIARPERKTSARKKATQELEPSLEKEPKKAKDPEKRAPDVVGPEDRKTKKAKLLVVEGSAKHSRAEKKATQEAEMAAREADAIAQAQRSVKLLSKSSTTKKAGKSIADTGPTNEVVRKLRESSEAESGTSSTPSNRNDAALKRRSMTPLFPSSTTVKPVKSALRTSEISNRRSVSFNDDPVALNSPTLIVEKSVKPLEKTNARGSAQGAAKTDSSQRTEPLSSPSDRAAKRCESDVLADYKFRRPSSSSSTTLLRDAESKPKVQTKLNLTRDVKLKGRVIDPSLPPKPVTPARNEEIVISSDSEQSESTFYSDEEDRIKPAKAGPSSKKKLSSSMKSGEATATKRTTTTARTSSSVPESIDIRKDRIRSPIIASSVKAGSKTILREMSKSRSPAQYMSRASPASSQSRSGTGSRTASESESGSESGSEDGSESESGSNDDAQASPRLASGVRSTSEGHVIRTERNGNQNVESKDLTVRESSKRSQSKLASSESSNASEERGRDEGEEDLAHQMEQQLQRECRQSMEPSRSRMQPALPLAKPVTQKAAPTQSPAAEPPKTRFPSLSGLRNSAPKDSAAIATAPRPDHTTTSNNDRRGAAQSSGNGIVHSSISSSESDDESSSSEDSDVDDTAPQQRQDGDGRNAKQPSSTKKSINRILKRTLLSSCRDTGKYRLTSTVSKKLPG